MTDVEATMSSNMNVRDELIALKNAMESLNAKNEALEAKNSDLEKRLNKQKSDIETTRADLVKFEEKMDEKASMEDLKPLIATNIRFSDVDQRNLNRLNQDSYTFLYCSEVCSVPSMVATLILMIQFIIFSLFFSNLLSTTDIPPDVDILVRTSQSIAIVIAFLAETDTRVSLRGLIYREGFVEINAKFSAFTIQKFVLAHIVMFLQGVLGMIVTLFLVFYSDNVFDLLLNFTAVMFISELDELGFLMGSFGFLGPKVERLTEKIRKVEYPRRYQKGCMRYFHIYIFCILLLGAYIGFGAVVRQQNRNVHLSKVIKVQFGDESLALLGAYSGCYALEETTGVNARAKYVQIQAERGQGQFYYCSDVKTWVFYTAIPGDDSNKWCNAFTLRSSETRPSSFDLLETRNDEWLLVTGNPISSFRLQVVDPLSVEYECTKVVWNDVWNDYCTDLSLSGDLVGFEGSREWSRNFNMLENGPSSYQLQFYDHPIYVGESVLDDEEDLDVVFFIGRRWVLARASSILVENTASKSTKDLISHFETKDAFWLSKLEPGTIPFVSEAVDQLMDRGTPLGLRWYNSRYPSSLDVFPYADISRPVDALFRCGVCDAQTNPCLFEGECQENGACLCKHGASGKLCDIKPLGDGVCQPYFNQEFDAYDGGDCCVATCSSISCGTGEMKYAFGQELQRDGDGFPNCVDPSMVPLSIQYAAEYYLHPSDDNPSFTQYRVELQCNGGDKVPLRVGLDPEIDISTNETVFVADKMGSCKLMFSGIPVYTKVIVSFSLFDGLISSGSGPVYMMKNASGVDEDTIFDIPALYSRCLKKILGDVMDLPQHLYTGSYQDKAVAWLSDELPPNDDCSNVDNLVVYLIERYALVALSFAEEGAEIWVNNYDHCRWNRVICSGGRVVQYSYDGSTQGYLSGPLAWDELILLANLEEISINNNDLTGTIPTEMGHLTSLEKISVYSNELNGTIPTGLSKITSLDRIDFGRNGLTGSIPTELTSLPKLKGLLLSYNRLTGSIPSMIRKLEKLIELELVYNDLTGSLPTELGALTSLERLLLFGNNLSGSIPMEIGQLIGLNFFDISQNELFGYMPTELGALTALERLDVGQNSLSGSIPLELGALTALTSCYMSWNQLTGSIPIEIGGLTNMAYLAITKNQLTGSIPQSFAAMTALVSLSLGENELTGSIPTEFAGLTNLESLRLGKNQLSGPIPITIGNLISLGSLDLHLNQISGSIPTELFLLSNLQYLDLSGNGITGTLPSEIGLLTGLYSLHLHDTLLEGPLPTELALLTNLNSNQFSLPIGLSNSSYCLDDQFCEDDPPGWFDADGPTFDCAWYAEDTRCEDSGDQFANEDGITANIACCACGGGLCSSPSEDPALESNATEINDCRGIGTCSDDPSGWYDADGPVYNCTWYAQEQNCEAHGDLFADDQNITANIACCACGGGRCSTSDTNSTKSYPAWFDPHVPN